MEEKDADSLDAIRRRYEALLHSVGDGVYGTDAAGRIAFANASAARLLGYRVEELLGKDAHELLHHSRPDGMPYPRDECPETAALRDGTVHHVRGGEALWRKDGKALGAELVVSPIPLADGMRGVLTTIRGTGDIERLEAAFRESEERFHRLCDASNDCVVLSENGRIVEVNARVSEVFGSTPQELVGKPVLDMVAPESRDLVGKHIRAGLEGTFEAKAVRKDGGSVPVEVTARSVPFKGRVARLAILRDLRSRPGPDASSIARPLVRRIVQDLTEAGGVAHQILQQVGRKLAEEASASDLDGLIREYAEMGLGEIKVEKRDGDRFAFTGTDLLERRPGARAATCYFTLGFLSEVASRVSRGEPTLGTEIECQSRGSAQCRFVVQVRKPEEGLARRVKELV